MVDSPALTGLPPLPPNVVDHAERRLTQGPEAAGRARRWLRLVCVGTGLPDVVTDNATVVVSELVANAAAYGWEPILVRLAHCTDGTLVLDVFDGAPVSPLLTWAVAAAFAASAPSALPSDPTDVDRLPVRGRGLPLVRALVTDLEVVDGDLAGKTVRAVFGTGPDGGSASVAAVTEPHPDGPAPITALPVRSTDEVTA